MVLTAFLPFTLITLKDLSNSFFYALEKGKCVLKMLSYALMWDKNKGGWTVSWFSLMCQDSRTTVLHCHQQYQ